MEGAAARSAQAEEPIDPTQRIIDAHHHLYDRPGHRYLAAEFCEDIASGHRIDATVFVQARGMYHHSGPDALRPVGETEFAAAQAPCRSAHGEHETRLCAGIVSYADLRLGAQVDEILEAHEKAGRGRLRGIRMPLAWDRDTSLLNPAYPTSRDMMSEPGFLSGFARLAPRGLRFDAWLFFHQLPDLARLARAYPDTQIIVDHCGGIIRAGAYVGKGDEVFRTWSAGLRELARCPNVTLKLSGLGMRLSNFDYGSDSPNSSSLAEHWRPWIERSIEYLGVDRCMFASNFPVDKGCYAYVTGWNAMQRLCSAASPDERDHLFWRSAARVYRLNDVIRPGPAMGA